MNATFDPKYLKAINEAFQETLGELSVNEYGAVSWDEKNSRIIDNFSKKVLKYKFVANYLLEWDLTLILMRKVSEISENKNKKGEKIEDILTKKEFEEEGQIFVNFIKGLPYKYEVYFQLFFDIPKEINELNIHPKVKIVRILDPESLGFEGIENKITESLVEALSRTLIRSPKKGEIYLRITSAGYSGETFDDSAKKEAYKIFKQFMYVGITAGVFKYDKWKPEPPIEPFSFILNDQIPAKPRQLQLPLPAVKFLPKVGLSPESFIPQSNIFGLGTKPPKKGTSEDTEKAQETFISKLKIFSKFLSADSSEKLPIEIAIDWAFEGLENDNKAMGFIQKCIALEALLGDRKQKEDITNRLADRCAYLLGRDRKNREYIRTQFMKIYELRSELIHGVKSDMNEQDQRLIFKAEDFLEKIILKEVKVFQY